MVTLGLGAVYYTRSGLFFSVCSVFCVSIAHVIVGEAFMRFFLYVSSKSEEVKGKG